MTTTTISGHKSEAGGPSVLGHTYLDSTYYRRDLVSYFVIHIALYSVQEGRLLHSRNAPSDERRLNYVWVEY